MSKTIRINYDGSASVYSERPSHDTLLADLRVALGPWSGSYRALDRKLRDALEHEGIVTLGDLCLVSRETLTNMKGIGPDSINRLARILSKNKLGGFCKDEEPVKLTITIAGPLAEEVCKIGRVGDKRPYEILLDAINLATNEVITHINNAAERARAEKAARLREEAHAKLAEAQALEEGL